MSGRGGRGIGIGSRVIYDHMDDDEDMSDFEDFEDFEDNDDMDEDMDEDMDDRSLIECPTCKQPLNLSSEVAQFRAQLIDQCCDCCCGSCGQRKKPGVVCCC